MNNKPDDWDDVKSKIIVLAEKNSHLLIKAVKLSAPVFCSKLIIRQPKLVRTELVFCIYLKLNYSTKEIAKFLNVSPKAIQNRKNRLRKKLNIASSVDLYQWFDSL